ncbi:2-oxo acid dehydrogenase subunit E2 [Buchnera aphidicola]|uniref:2-oxo acid dehydrogenase subunit E2 n=1 Tax=Buchnera aphidicola TaxID=9 RepID=UPI0031B6F936
MSIEVKIPDIGSDLVEVIEILVKKNDKVKKEQSLILVEGQKASMEIPSPDSGVIKKISVNVGQKVKHNDVILIMEKVNDKISSNPKDFFNIVKEDKEVNTILNADDLKKKSSFHATPLVRRLARLLQIDLKNLSGSGRKGRILKEDLELYKNRKNKEEKFLNSNKENINYNIYEIEQEDKKSNRVIFTKIQTASSYNLQKSWNTIPHVTQFYESDITELEKFRKEVNIIKNYKVNEQITLLSIITKVVAKSLKKFPLLNSFFSNKKNGFIFNEDINIGIAVNTSEGLLVPVIKEVNKKELFQLSCEINKKCRDARNNTLTLLDFQGGSFTISSLGKLGGKGFTPIINAPQVGILGVSKTIVKPIWKNKNFSPCLVLPFSLSYDHRIIDGVYGANFMEYVSQFLSDIRLLTL